MADRPADSACHVGVPQPGLKDACTSGLCVLDLAFGAGEAFFRTWREWENASDRPSMLHYVAVVTHAPRLDDLHAAQHWRGDEPGKFEQLAAQWQGLEPGFQRLSLAQGRLLLTLWWGPMDAGLREMAFVADRIWLDSTASGNEPNHWNVWHGKALARVCRRGTQLWCRELAPAQHAALTASGFVIHEQGHRRGEYRHCGDYSPRWEIRHTRVPFSTQVSEATSCVVIGAGLAGASIAATLARRGWQVDVLDRADTPAAGASGLPAGLLVPHVSADDCPLSRLSRAGVRSTLAQARTLLHKGLDWGPTGVMELPLRGASRFQASGADERWHANAAWVKPAKLVQAWLAQPGIRFLGGSQVSALRRHLDHWEVMNPDGRQLARAKRVILANGLGALPLLTGLQQGMPPWGMPDLRLPALSGVYGLVSWGFEDEVPQAQFPAWPVNGSGSLAPGIPVGERKAWFAGAGYHPCELPVPSASECHRANLDRLTGLLPELAQTLKPAFEKGRVHAWEQIRCATPDRLPLAGPVDEDKAPGLWLFVGLGSRGLTFSALGAELIAARWAGEPLPLSLSLARRLEAARAMRPPQTEAP